MKKPLVLFLIFAGLTSYDAIAQKRTKGKTLTGYDAIYPFKNGRAKVEKNGKIGFIDMNGEEVIKCKYDAIYPFENGKAKVELNGKYGFINEQGEEIIEPKFDYIGPFKNGRAIVRFNGKLEIIDEEGNVLTEGNHGG